MIRYYWRTLKHKWHVGRFLVGFALRLLWRALVHDLSKFRPDEAREFMQTADEMGELTYGSEEYHEHRGALTAALKLHYRRNRHHPEHFAGEWDTYPLRGMNLTDTVEMFCDWRAAVRRHEDGDLFESVWRNGERYGYRGEFLHEILWRSTERIYGEEQDGTV